MGRVMVLVLLALMTLLVGCGLHTNREPANQTTATQPRVVLPSQTTTSGVVVGPSDESSAQVVVGFVRPNTSSTLIRVPMSFTPETTYQVGREPTTTLAAAVALGIRGRAGDGVVWWGDPVARITYHKGPEGFVLDDLWVPEPH